MSGWSGRRRARGGDVVIHAAAPGDTPDVLEVHTGAPAAWSPPAYRISNPPRLVAGPGGGLVEDPALAVAETLAAAGGVMIVRERR